MAKWVKSITLAILLGILLLGLYILFPNKNKVVQIKELNYATLFNDQNGVQLKSAAKFGIKQPLKNRDAADNVKDSLVHIKSNSHYSIAKLTHSILPQMFGLGTSEMARHYGIRGREEAKEYINCSILRDRLVEITEAVYNSDKTVYEIFGNDAIKVRSCMLLFASVCDIPIFKKMVNKYSWK